MSKRIAEIVLSGGMNNVVLPHMLSSNDAEEIRNLYLDKDGLWKDINNPENILDLSETHLKDAVRVVWWKPTKVPADCIDDFVYVVFTDSGTVRFVYRSLEGVSVYTLNISAKISGTDEYIAVPISGVTTDIKNESDGMTIPQKHSFLTRQYWDNTNVKLTAAPEISSGEMFLRWARENGLPITRERTLSMIMRTDETVIAEYIDAPYIMITDADGESVDNLGEFEAIPGGYSEIKKYYVWGIGLINPIVITPPEKFQIRKETSPVWVGSPNSIQITANTANNRMTEILVRYAPPVRG